ncbi:TPA: hypothetical protein N0F65_012744 [Lagenidium giganteum]|uniref:Uncharacterized protein n=1 Tax=Lagenidium giganteum TaxID=4803 RepID=A0AAV2YGN9_9STRA|nr:TPA: hypothetical protein N0F65_012744 [Lagenidium giganteum]
MISAKSSLCIVIIALFGLCAAQEQPEDSSAMRPTIVDIASHHHLDHATGLVNKNTVAHSNNIAITKSNIAFRQNDDVSLESKDEDARVPSDVTMMSAMRDRLRMDPTTGAMMIMRDTKSTTKTKEEQPQ